jgi:F420-non-reducing hydrogenase small subunit
LHEAVLDLVETIDIALWPVALDTKRKAVQAWKPGDVAVAFINGAVRMTEQEDWVKLLRQKCPLVVAFGACAHLGGIPGLANNTTREEILANKYARAPTLENPEGIYPREACQVEGHALELPRFWNEVKPLNQVIDVDYYLPGCPPPASSVAAAIRAVLNAELPPKGAVLALDKSLCESCPRRDSKPEQFSISRFKRIATSIPDPEECFLAQGYVCLGPATRTGCGERCLRGNMPCRGCFGPTPGCPDQGAKILSMVCSLGAAEDEREASEFAETLVDPLGTFYRFSLPASLLRRSRQREEPVG